MLNSTKSVFTRFATWLVLAVVSLPAVAMAQVDDDLDTLRNLPLKYLKLDSVKLNLDQLHWQADRKKMSARVLDDRLEQARDELLTFLTRRAELVESMPPEFRFADDKARSEAASRCLQELLTVRLDQASHEALLEEMEQSEPSDVDQARLDLRKQQIQAQIRYRESELAQAKSDLEHTSSLAERQYTNEADVRKAESELQQARTKLESEWLNFQILEQEAMAPASREIQEVRRQIRALGAREQAIRRFLEQLNETAVVSQQIRRLDEGIQIRQEIVNRLNMQQLEIQNAIDDFRVLQQQVEEAMKDLSDDDENEK